MSKQLRRAEVFLSSAKFGIERRDEDSAFLDVACFDLQQSIQFALSYWLEMLNVQHDRTLSIVNLISQLVAHGENADILFEINNNTDLYRYREECSRECDNFSCALQDVTATVELATRLITRVKSIYS